MKFLVCFAALLVCASGAVRRLGLSQDGTYWPERHQQDNQRLLGLSQDGTYWPDRFQNGRQLFGLTQDDTQGGKRLLGLSQDGTYWPERSGQANRHHTEGQDGHHQYGMSSNPAAFVEPDNVPAFSDSADAEETVQQESRQSDRRRPEGQHGRHFYGYSHNPASAARDNYIQEMNADVGADSQHHQQEDGQRRLLGRSQDGTYWPQRSRRGHHGGKRVEGINGRHFYGMSYNPASAAKKEQQSLE